MTRQPTRSIFLLAATAALASCGLFEEPPLPCPVQRLTWATRLVLKEGQDPTSPCAQKHGERMGIQKYNDPATGENQLVIKPETLAGLDEEDPVSPGYSLGAFPSAPDANGLCIATSLSVAEKHVPATGSTPAVDITYRWHQVQVLSTPEAPGSQLWGDLTYTEGTCAAEYEVWGVWPAISCEGESDEPDDSLCSQSGSGLNPDFALVCDPTQLRCVPARRPPSLR